MVFKKIRNKVNDSLIKTSTNTVENCKTILNTIKTYDSKNIKKIKYAINACEKAEKYIDCKNTTERAYKLLANFGNYYLEKAKKLESIKTRSYQERYEYLENAIKIYGFAIDCNVKDETLNISKMNDELKNVKKYLAIINKMDAVKSSTSENKIDKFYDCLQEILDLKIIDTKDIMYQCDTLIFNEHLHLAKINFKRLNDKLDLSNLYKAYEYYSSATNNFKSAEETASKITKIFPTKPVKYNATNDLKMCEERKQYIAYYYLDQAYKNARVHYDSKNEAVRFNSICKVVKYAKAANYYQKNTVPVEHYNAWEKSYNEFINQNGQAIIKANKKSREEYAGTINSCFSNNSTNKDYASTLDEGNANYNEGLEYYQNDNFEEAIKCFTRAKECGVDCNDMIETVYEEEGILNYNKGLECYQNDEFEAAKRYFIRARECGIDCQDMVNMSSDEWKVYSDD